MPQPEGRPSLFGALAILVVGLVILVPSGLCTGGIILSALLQVVTRYRFDSTQIMILVALAVGGPFVLGGSALILTGVRRLRARRDGADQ